MAFSWQKRLIKNKEYAARQGAQPQFSVFPISLSSITVHKPDMGEADIYLNREVLPVQEGDFLEVIRDKASVIVKVEGSSFRESKQVSIAQPLAEVLGFERSASVQINTAKVESYVIEEAEISFKDQNVQRGDMWRLGLLIPDNTPVYPAKFLLINGIRAKIKRLKLKGKEAASGVITKKTHFVFSSRSADTYLIYELSKEMYEFDESVQGGLVYLEKAISFLKALLERWMLANATHRLHIILSARLFYPYIKDEHSYHLKLEESFKAHTKLLLSKESIDTNEVYSSSDSVGNSPGLPTSLPAFRMNSAFLNPKRLSSKNLTFDNEASLKLSDFERLEALQRDKSGALYNDVYKRVISTQFSKEKINSIVNQVKKEILAFPSFVNWSINLPDHMKCLLSLKEEIIRESPIPQKSINSPGLPKPFSFQHSQLEEQLRVDTYESMSEVAQHRSNVRLTRFSSFNMLACELSSSRASNFLECINVGLDYLCNNAYDVHLGLTGGQLLIISGGSGVYDVNRDLLESVKYRVNSNIPHVSIVSLQPRPLHEVPVFVFEKQEPLDINLSHRSAAEPQTPTSFPYQTKAPCESADWLFFHSFPHMSAFRTHILKLPHTSAIYSIKGGVAETSLKNEFHPSLTFRGLAQNLQNSFSITPSRDSLSFALLQTPARSHDGEYDVMTETQLRSTPTLSLRSNDRAMRNLMSDFDTEHKSSISSFGVQNSLFRNYQLQKPRQYDQLIGLISLPQLAPKAQEAKKRKQKHQEHRFYDKKATLQEYARGTVASSISSDTEKGLQGLEQNEEVLVYEHQEESFDADNFSEQFMKSEKQEGISLQQPFTLNSQGSMLPRSMPKSSSLEDHFETLSDKIPINEQNFLGESRRTKIQREREHKNPFLPKQSASSLFNEKYGRRGGWKQPKFTISLPSKSRSERRWEFSSIMKRDDDESFWSRICDVPLLPLYISSSMTLTSQGQNVYSIAVKQDSVLFQNDPYRIVQELIQSKLSQGFQLVDSDRCVQKYENLARLQKLKMLLNDCVQKLDFSEVDNIQIEESKLKRQDKSNPEGQSLTQHHLVFNSLEHGFRTKQLTYNLLKTSAFSNLDDWIAGYGHYRVQTSHSLLIPSVVFAIVFDHTHYFKPTDSIIQKEQALERVLKDHLKAFSGFKTDLMAAISRRGFQRSNPTELLEMDVRNCGYDQSRANLVLENKISRHTLDILKPTVVKIEDEPLLVKKSSIFSAQRSGLEKRSMVGLEGDSRSEEIFSLRYDSHFLPGQSYHIGITWVFATGPLIYDQVILLQRIARSNGLKLLQLSQRLAQRSQLPARLDQSLLEDVISIRLPIPGPKKRRTVVAKESNYSEAPMNFKQIQRAQRCKEFVLFRLSSQLFFPPLSYIRDFEVVKKNQHLATTYIHVSGAAIVTLFHSGQIKWMRNELAESKKNTDNTKQAKELFGTFERNVIALWILPEIIENAFDLLPQ